LGWQETPRYNVYRTFRSSGPFHNVASYVALYTSSNLQDLAFHFFPPPAGPPVGPACLESCPWISLS